MEDVLFKQGDACSTLGRERLFTLFSQDLLIWLGVWRSGSASALHAEGLGFDPLVVHTFSFCSVLN
jgi:hypothetical protein